MDADSDESVERIQIPKKSKTKSKVNSGATSNDPYGPARVKPQVAKKLRKEKRLQKLLQKLDNDAKKSHKVDSSFELAASSQKSEDSTKRKKRNKKNKVKVSGDVPNVVEGNHQVNASEYTNDTFEGKGRSYSVSIAVSGSIIDNAQSPLLMAYLAGQIARAAAIFTVDEVIVFDDNGGNSKAACELMARVLQFLECPQYLRKHVFPIHQDLQFAGVIAPLDIPHHLRRHEALPYREGVVSSKPTKEGKDVSYIYVGLDRECRVEKKLPEGVRVTVKFDNPDPNYILKPKGKLKGKVISPHVPRTEAGLYWGYTVRIAESLNKVFTECPFRDTKGYDLTLGTSEKGTPVSKLRLPPKSYKHILIVFGGVEGLEYALENDETLMEDDVSVLFDHYVNTCPSQGSRTIRTEEAILISMTSIAPIISACCSR